MSIERIGIQKLYMFPIVVLVLMVWKVPAYSQFADLPHDAKTVNIGVNGDGASQTLSLTAVVPRRRVNGWTDVFGSRTSGQEEVLSEIVKARIQGGFRIGTFGIEAFTDLDGILPKGVPSHPKLGVISVRQFMKEARFAYLAVSVHSLRIYNRVMTSL